MFAQELVKRNSNLNARVVTHNFMVHTEPSLQVVACSGKTLRESENFERENRERKSSSKHQHPTQRFHFRRPCWRWEKRKSPAASFTDVPALSTSRENDSPPTQPSQLDKPPPPAIHSFSIQQSWVSHRTQKSIYYQCPFTRFADNREINRRALLHCVIEL